jgi:hypothetical protein
MKPVPNTKHLEPRTQNPLIKKNKIIILPNLQVVQLININYLALIIN